MELYETLYAVPASEIEVDDLIRFDWMDEDLTIYVETVRVTDVDYDVEFDKVEVSGFSETLNLTTQYTIDEDSLVEVLGG